MQQAANLLGLDVHRQYHGEHQCRLFGHRRRCRGWPCNGTLTPIRPIYNYLKRHASPGDTSFDFLPAPGSANAPTEIVVWNAQLKAMGLDCRATATATDDGVVYFAYRYSIQARFSAWRCTNLRMRWAESRTALRTSWSSIASAAPEIASTDGNIPAAASYFSMNGGATAWAAYGIGSDPSDFLNSQ